MSQGKLQILTPIHSLMKGSEERGVGADLGHGEEKRLSGELLGEARGLCPSLH